MQTRALCSDAVGITGTHVFIKGLTFLPNVNSRLVISTLKRLHKLYIRCLLVLLEYEAAGQNCRDMYFFNSKSNTEVTGALFEQEKTIKHFTDEAAIRDRQPIPHKTSELYQLS